MAFASNSIPFSHFADLCETLASLAPRRAGQKRKATGDGPTVSTQLQVVRNCIKSMKEVYSPGEDGLLPEGTVRIFLRLFFPDEGPRRRYGMQETILANHLCRHFQIKEGRFDGWNAPSLEDRSIASGCLGTEVKMWMDHRGRGRREARVSLSIGRVDELLDELAAKCSFSAKDVVYSPRLPYPRRATSVIISDLFSHLTSFETCLMIQLILRDLSPILYPLPSMSGHAALSDFNSAAYSRVEVHQALSAWHPAGDAWYRVVKDLDLVGAVLETSLRSGVDPPNPAPVFGAPIQIPKTSRPGTCAVACKNLRGKAAVETKYDGERLQIHIDLARPPRDQIRIFSKSTRESTAERRRLLPIIRAALSLPPSPFEPQDYRLQSRVQAHYHLSTTPHPSRLIIEGEMVPYDEDSGKIEEFWKLGHAKGGTDVPPSPGRHSQTSEKTGETMSQEIQSRWARVEEPSLHLKVVWFDLLAVEDEVLLDVSFEERRARLASLVQDIPGYSKLAESVDIDFGSPTALSDLRLRFAHVITSRAEGLMLKPLTSRYNDHRLTMRWVKLKKDFIPGAGDTLDFHVVGARWSRDRGRELLVPPSTYTTFFIGLRADELGARFSKIDKPHYHVLFAASYGLSRRQLGDLDADIRKKDPMRFDFDGTSFQKCARPKANFAVFESPCTSFTFSLACHLVSANSRPSIIFKTPRVFELNGAGFQRSSGSPLYELRWPRITKVNRLDGDPLSLAALQQTAREAMREVSAEGSQNFVQLLWSKITHVQAPETEQERYDRELPLWIARLEKADKVRPADSLLRPSFSHDGISITRLPPLEPVTNAGDRTGGRATATFSGTDVENQLTWSSSVRIDDKLVHETVKHFDIDLTTSPVVLAPRRTSPAISPSRRSLPLSSPPHPRSPPRLTRLNALPTSPTSRPLGKRPRASCPSILPSASFKTGAFAGANPPSSNVKCRGERASLPFLCDRPLTPLGSTPLLPSSDYSWSLLARSTIASIPQPRHPFLDAENHFRNPLDVLWLAGWIPLDRSAPFQGARRQGFVFVERGQMDVDWLLETRGVRSEGTAAPVWVVERTACETRGEWDMNEAILSIM